MIELTHNWGHAGPYAWAAPLVIWRSVFLNVYETSERLAADVKIPRPAGPMAHGGSVIASIENPDGYRIELVQRP